MLVRALFVSSALLLGGTVSQANAWNHHGGGYGGGGWHGGGQAMMGRGGGYGAPMMPRGPAFGGQMPGSFAPRPQPSFAGPPGFGGAPPGFGGPPPGFGGPGFAGRPGFARQGFNGGPPQGFPQMGFAGGGGLPRPGWYDPTFTGRVVGVPQGNGFAFYNQNTGNSVGQWTPNIAGRGYTDSANGRWSAPNPWVAQAQIGAQQCSYNLLLGGYTGPGC